MVVAVVVVAVVEDAVVVVGAAAVVAVAVAEVAVTVAAACGIHPVTRRLSKWKTPSPVSIPTRCCMCCKLFVC